MRSGVYIAHNAGGREPNFALSHFLQRTLRCALRSRAKSPAQAEKPAPPELYRGAKRIFLATLLERALRCALWMGISMSGDKIADPLPNY